jgi:hypothetical protein
MMVWIDTTQVALRLPIDPHPFIKDVDDRQPDLIQERDSCQKYPLYRKTFFLTLRATKSASDRRHGSPRRTVRIRLDIGRRLRRCPDRRLSEGPGLRTTRHRSAEHRTGC